MTKTIAVKKNFNQKQTDNLYGFLFVAPQLIGLLIFVVLPFLFAVYLCFCEWDFMNAPTFCKHAAILDFKEAGEL